MTPTFCYFIGPIVFFTSKSLEEAVRVCSLNDDGYSESSETRMKKSILKDKRLKSTFPINYHISRGVNRRLIKEALTAIERETCIRFKESNNFRDGGINYVNKSRNCFSFMGKISLGKPEEVVLGSACNALTIVIHETMHALGVIHEFSRHDRNSCIKVRFENIVPGLRFNYQTFALSKATPYGLKYDFGSVMHYNRLSGSKKGRVTMEPKYLNYLETIGQTTRFGFNDAKQLNIHYCKDKCRGSTLKCKMGGYPHPNDCRFCKCPAFFTGKLCTKLLPSDKKCGVTRFKTKNTNTLLIVKGIKTCYIQITAPRGRKVLLNILETNFDDHSFVCQPNKGLEVKFFADKAVSGAMFCRRNSGKIIKSQNNVIVMKYVGLIPSNRIRIQHRDVA
uniref:Metalloendopeptidase n=1 Tax=Strongyloides papillosus TaxID=174720 RepID=A0A0N5BCH0_STREA